MKRTALALATLLLVTGCPEEGLECTDMATSSVSLTVLNDAGVGLAGADVSYTVDGGESVDCEDFGGGEYVCGWEEAGELEVTIAAMGFAVDTFTATVGEDECHVITEVVERTLDPIDCTMEVVAGVLVNITDSQLAEVTSATVTWEQPNADMGETACSHMGGNQWSCAEEAAGMIAIRITEAGPYEAFEQLLDVEHDGCHPITETLDAVLSYLPD